MCNRKFLNMLNTETTATRRHRSLCRRSNRRRRGGLTRCLFDRHANCVLPPPLVAQNGPDLARVCSYAGAAAAAVGINAGMVSSPTTDPKIICITVSLPLFQYLTVYPDAAIGVSSVGFDIPPLLPRTRGSWEPPSLRH